MDEEKKVKKSSGTKKKTSQTGAKKNTTKKTSSKSTTTKAKTPTTKSTAAKKSTTTVKKATAKTTEAKARKTKTTSKSTVKKDKILEVKEEKPQVTVLESTIMEETVVGSVESTKEEVKSTEELPKNELKKIPLSNYLIAAIIVVWIFILAFLGYQLHKNHQEKLYQEGYFYHHNTSINKTSLDKISSVLANSQGSVFVLFNYRGSEDTYRLEEDLDQVIQDYHFNDQFYYVDLTEMMGKANCDLTCVVQSEFHVTLKNVPAILYYQDGNLVDIAQRDDQKVLEAADYVKLLDMYEFKK